MIYFFQLLSAIILDALVGDPRWYPHPVKGIGKLCSLSESITRSMIGNLYLAGFVTVICVLSSTAVIVGLILFAAASVSSTFLGVVGVILLYTTFAARDLLHHSNEVYVQLTNNTTLENARLAVGKIVGRDTSKLDQDGVCRATIETVAENMVDGITAPLFFAILASCFSPLLNLSPIACSVIGAFLYKAVNTMDSMIAYKNDKYIKFGRVAAKLDDAVNFFPARISGVCLIMAAFILKLDYRTATKVFLQDRLNHASPNAGQTESATAGALGLRLGGPSTYFNDIVEKPFIGASGSEPAPLDIKKTNHLIMIGSMVFFVFLIGLRLVLI